MYVITINEDQTLYFENFQEIVPYVKQEIRKHMRNNDSSYIASYDEWFLTDNHTIYDCDSQEIDDYFMDENNVVEVYGIRFYQRQRNVIFHYENTVRVMHVSYIPKFEAHNFIDLPEDEDNENDSTEETEDDSSDEDVEQEETEETEDDSSDEDVEQEETEETEDDSSDEDVEQEETENETRERTDSEKQIENEVSEFTSIN
jgi:hypothetical protein